MGKDDQGQRWQSAARSYRAALARLVRGEGRHADHAGRVVKITPTSVAREAGRSRNPLYTSHRDIATLETELTHLRANARRHAEERRELASENLTLLHRARSAEDRLTALLRRMPEASTAGAIMQPR